MNALQLGNVIGVGNAHWAEILCAEPGQALFGDGNADFLDAVDVTADGLGNGGGITAGRAAEAGARPTRRWA